MVGRTVGKYRVVEKVGRGGMGIVYKAVDETLDREVAVKVLNPDLADAAVVKRFRAEAMTLARLNHPGIATIFELLLDGDDLLMIMEFVRGETLDRVVERVGPLPIGRATSLVAHVLEALGHAHRVGIVHRDLKPANLMLTEYGSIKIMDFGIARVLGSEHLTSDGLMMGTPAYMAPEQVLASDIDARADLYSVGVVLYRLITGNLPFKADTAIAMAHKQLKDPPTPLRQFRAEVPAWCDGLLSRALAKSPADRFQTAEEFRDALIRQGASLAPAAASFASLEATLPPDRLAALAPAAGAPPDASVDVTEQPTYATTLPPPTPGSGTGAVRPTVERREELSVVGDPASDAPGGAQGTPSIESIAPPFPDPPMPTAPPKDRPSSSPGSVTVQKRHLTMVAGAFGLLVIASAAVAFFVVPRMNAPAAVQPPVTAAPAAPTAPAPDRAPERAVSTAAPSREAVKTAPPPRETVPPPAPARAAPRRPAAVPPVARDAALAPLTVSNLRIVVADGERLRERDAIATFAAGTLTLSVKDGPVVRSIPYDQILSLHYSRTRQPMWQTPGGTAAPVMRVPGGAFGLFRSDPHWLAIQTKEVFLVLRLAPEHMRSLPAAFSDRAGVQLTIVRPDARR